MVGGGDIRAGVELSTSSYHRTKMRAKEAAGPCFLWCCDLTLQVQTDPKNEGERGKACAENLSPLSEVRCGGGV